MQVIRANLKDKNGKVKKGKDMMAGDCVFPFKFKGQLQNKCVIGKTGDWCATEISDKKAVRKWGYCNINGKKVRIDLRRTKVRTYDPTEKKELKKSSDGKRWVKDTKSQVKDCPLGKVLNQKTGRCVIKPQTLKLDSWQDYKKNKYLLYEEDDGFPPKHVHDAIYKAVIHKSANFEKVNQVLLKYRKNGAHDTASQEAVSLHFNKVHKKTLSQQSSSNAKVLTKSGKTQATEKKTLKKSSKGTRVTEKKALKKSSKGNQATEKKELKKKSIDPLSADRVLSNNKEHNQTESKYCSCLMKVRGNSLKNEKVISPYGICTASLYNKQDKVRMKRVRCSKYYNFNLYPLNYLQAYAIEKKIPYKAKTGNMYSKAVLLKHISKYLEKKDD